MGQVRDQVFVLLKKDWIQRLRHWKATLAMLACPILLLLIAVIFVFFVQEEPVIKPYQTISDSNQILSIPFDPFPLNCAEVAPAQQETVENPRDETQRKQTVWSQFDCFIDAMGNIIPFWRSLVLQLKQLPRWKPRKVTFAVAPGIQGDTTTLGGQFARYLDKRYEEKMKVAKEMYSIFNDRCFSVVTSVPVNLTTILPHPSDGGRHESAAGYASPSEACVSGYPVECLSACARGQFQSSFAVGETFAERLNALAVSSRRLSNKMFVSDEDEEEWRLLSKHNDEMDAIKSGKKNSNDVLNKLLNGERQNDLYDEIRLNAIGHELEKGKAMSFTDLFVSKLQGKYSKVKEEKKEQGLFVEVNSEKNAKLPKGNPNLPINLPISSVRELNILDVFLERRLKMNGLLGDGGKGDTLGIMAKIQSNMARKSKLKFTNPDSGESVNNIRRKQVGSAMWKVVMPFLPEPITNAISKEIPAELDRHMSVEMQEEMVLLADEQKREQKRRNLLQSQISQALTGPISWKKDYSPSLSAAPSSSTESAEKRQLVTENDCETLSTPCECAEHHTACGWRAEDDTTDAGECTKAYDGKTQTVTSCFECQTITGLLQGNPNAELCRPDSLWYRLGQALPLLQPYVKVYGDEVSMDKEIIGRDYPKNLVLPNGTPYSTSICGAVTFFNADSSLAAAKTNTYLEFSIRTNSSDTLGAAFGFQPTIKVSPRPRVNYARAYTRSGYLGMQMVVNEFLSCTDESKGCLNSPLYQSTTAVNSMKWSIGHFGIPKYWSNIAMNMLFGADGDVPGSVYRGLCFPLLFLVGKLLAEKTMKIREGMRMMGMRDSAFYLETLLFHFTWSVIAGTLVGVVWIIIPKFNEFTSPVWHILYFIILELNILQFGVFLASFFSGSSAATFGRIAVFGLATFFVILPVVVPSMERGMGNASRIHLRRFLGMIPGCNIVWTVNIWAEWEFKTDGVNFDTVGRLLESGKTYWSYLDGLIMALIGIFFWSAWAAYLDQIMPSEFGIPRRWFFPFTKQFWLNDVLGQEEDDFDQEEGGGAPNPNDRDQVTERKPSLKDNTGFYFEEPTAIQLSQQQNDECVKVRRLRKEFQVDGVKLVAVNDINLTMYRDEIFVLLGHNGAGKTTTFSMLTGLISQSSGECSFYGRSLKEQLATRRNKVGVCPQHSVLWPDMTCMEHLMLFAAFKGVPHDEAVEQAKELLREQNMEAKKDSLAATLSGGMQRKLSLAIAFMGDPDLVFLDEPSSGMDTSARRGIWDLLRTRKEGRVIVLTTHYMDEADVLADRVAIMAHGTVKCAGSSQFLKDVYGCGYNLSFNFSVPAAQVVGAFEKFVCNDLFGSAPGKVKLLASAGSELLFLAPFEVCPLFESAFTKIEDRKEELSIISWNLLVCNLEEVFLKVASNEQMDEKALTDDLMRQQTSSLLLGEQRTASREAPLLPHSGMHSNAEGVHNTIMLGDSRQNYSTQANEEASRKGSAIGGEFAQAGNGHPAPQLQSGDSLHKEGDHQAGNHVRVAPITGGAHQPQAGNHAKTTDCHANLTNGGGKLTEGCHQAEEGATVALNPSGARQFIALLQKRFLNAKRYYGITFCQLFCPFFYLLVIIIFIKISMLETPRLELTARTHYNQDLDNEMERNQLALAHMPHNPGSLSSYMTVLGIYGNSPAVLYPDTLSTETCPLAKCEAATSGAKIFGADSIYGGCPRDNYKTANKNMISVLSYTLGAKVANLFPPLQFFTPTVIQVNPSNQTKSRALDSEDESTTLLQGKSRALDSEDESTTLQQGDYKANEISADKSTVLLEGDLKTNVIDQIEEDATMKAYVVEQMQKDDVATMESEEKRQLKVTYETDVRPYLQKLDYWLERQVPNMKREKSRMGSYVFGTEKASGAAGSDEHILIKINGTGVHASAILLQGLYDGAQIASGSGGNRIPFIHLLPQTIDQKTKALNANSFILGMAIVLSFGFVSCFGLVFICDEKTKEIKTQQYVNGVSIIIYWLSNLAWDAVLYWFPIGSVLIIFEAFEVTLFTNSRAIGGTMCLLLFFSFAMPLFQYCTVHFFKDSNSALNVAMVINVVLGAIIFLFGLLLEIIPYDKTRMVLKDWSWLVRFWPVYSLGEGVRRIFFASFLWTTTPPDTVPKKFWAECEAKYKKHEVPPWDCCQSIFDKFGAGPAIQYLGITAVLYLIIVIAIDYLQQDVGFRQKMEPKAALMKEDPVNVRPLRDASVIKMEGIVEGATEEHKKSAGIFMKRLSKVFKVLDIAQSDESAEKRQKRGCEACCTAVCPCCQCCFDMRLEKKDVHAVRDVNLRLEKGDVLGLLGANGAGKTTTFRMMCGVEVPAMHSETEIWVGGYNLMTERQQCRKVIGYTAQANPIWPALTVEEHLRFYAVVKGVAPDQMDAVVNKTVDDMDLRIHVHKRSGNLSGGNKRKLVIAMSLIGIPPVLFLDEPSAGMDPDARRNMWAIIQKVATQTRQSTVVLTSHSMDEVEALCSQVVIQTHGIYRTIGSIPEIKATYGNGLDLFVKFNSANNNQLQDCGKRISAPSFEDKKAMIAFPQACALLQANPSACPLAQNLLYLMANTRSSPFLTVSRCCLKPKISMQDQVLMQQDAIRVTNLLQWVIQSEWRLEMQSWVVGAFKGAYEIDSQGGSEQVTYRVYKEAGTNLGTLFGKVESVKTKYNIRQYAITPTTLEQIFNEFAKTQLQDLQTAIGAGGAGEGAGGAGADKANGGAGGIGQAVAGASS